MNEPRPPQKPENGKSPIQCQVQGCPLPGAYRITNETSLCCVHDGEDPRDWAGQTDRIKVRLKLLWLMLAMQNALPGEPIKESTIEGVVDEGGPDAEGCTTQRQYAQTIRAFLMKELKGEHKAPVQLTPVKALVAKLTAATHD